MSNEVGLPYKTFAALRAGKRLLTSVARLVLQKVRFLGEMFAAFSALKELLAQVSPLVVKKTCSSRKTLATFGT